MSESDIEKGVKTLSDATLVNFASLFTNPAIIAILRELVNGKKSVSDLVEASGMSESDIEKGVKTLSDATG